MKECTVCHKEKAISDFGTRSDRPLGVNSQCKSCHNEICKKYVGRYNEQRSKARLANKDISRGYNLKKKYGMTIGEWESLFNSQGRRCAICQRNTPSSQRGWATDHDHKTNVVRGILCVNCNLLIGHALDDICILEKTIQYLLMRGTA